MSNKITKVAITGGIGSGKSFVATLFQGLGIPVYNADREAKRLMNSEQSLKKSIRELLGQDAYHRNGRLNRSFVAEKVFGSRSLLKALNALVHPAVRQDFERWAERQDSPYVLEESAIVFESGLAKYFKAVILVAADKALRIQRVMKRDRLSQKEVIERMKNQNPQSRNIESADYVIVNDGSKSLLQQVQKVHQEILKLALK